MAAKGNSAKSKEPGAIAKLYLRAYNFSLILGWSYILYLLALHQTGTGGAENAQKSLWDVVGPSIIIFQNAAVLEANYTCISWPGSVQSSHHNVPSTESCDGRLWSLASHPARLCSCFPWFAYRCACMVRHRNNKIFILFHELDGLCASLHCLAQIHDIYRTVPNWHHRRIVVLLLGSNVRKGLSRRMELCPPERLEFHVQLSLFTHIRHALVHTTFPTDVSAHVRSKTQSAWNASGKFHEQESSVNIPPTRRYASCCAARRNYSSEICFYKTIKFLLRVKGFIIPKYNVQLPSSFFLYLFSQLYKITLGHRWASI